MNPSIKELCRVCLQNKGTFPLFSKVQHTNIGLKLCMCLNEKIDNINDYPKNICGPCNKTLDIILEFVNTYKKSYKLLHKMLIKKEKVELLFANVDKNIFNINIEDNMKVNHQDTKDKNVYKLSYGVKPEYDIFADIDNNIMTDIKIEENSIIDNRGNEHTEKLLQKSDSLISEIKSVYDLNHGNLHKPCKLKKNVLLMKTPKRKLRQAKKESKEASGIKTKLQFQSEGLYPKKSISDTKKNVEKSSNPKCEKLCDACGEVFKNQDKLTNHKKKFHPKELFKCPHDKCSKVCNTSYNLSRHIKRRHNEHKEFICNICAFKFAFKAELTNHLKSHDRKKYPSKIYACKFCTKTFKCQKSVTVHERSLHTGLRPVVCNVCAKAFFHEDYLKEHMRLHTGETPFKCPLCSRGYAQRCNMKSHLRSHKLSELDSVSRLKIKPNYLKLLKS